MPLEETIYQPEVNDVGRILDNNLVEWVAGYQNFFKQAITKTFIDNITFDNVTSLKTSKKFLCAPYRKFTLLLDLAITATPTDILIEIYVSDDNSKFYKLMSGVFSDLRYEDAAGDKMEAIQGEINSPYIRIRAIATGTSSVNKFTLTAKISFAS